MSDLSRLRARLVRIERTGKRLKREIEEIREPMLGRTGPLTRTEEGRILRLEAEIEQARRDWSKVWQLVRNEERRLIENPAGFLRFT